MIRFRLWFRCAAMHDPVSPIVVKPAIIGWDAKERKVELRIERAFTGEELVKRMKGWVTIDPSRVIEVIGHHGRLKVLDDRDLVVELEDEKGFKELQSELREHFGNELDLEPSTS
ncbi:MAG: hypothetical protein JSW70_07725 [Syntrophobacterales bacterium]|nr:MAG: hypothetical protein JSW70_07725 [Syntrophobacterales bacterium]